MNTQILTTLYYQWCRFVYTWCTLCGFLFALLFLFFPFSFSLSNSWYSLSSLKNQLIMTHVLIWWFMITCGFQILPFVLKYYILSLNHFLFWHQLVHHGAEYYLHSWIHEALGSSILPPIIVWYSAWVTLGLLTLSI